MRSREVFSARWKQSLEDRYRYDLSWRSIINFPIGYAMSSRELLKALDRLLIAGYGLIQLTFGM